MLEVTTLSQKVAMQPSETNRMLNFLTLTTPCRPYLFQYAHAIVEMRLAEYDKGTGAFFALLWRTGKLAGLSHPGEPI